MTEQPLLGQLLVFGAGAAVVGVWIDADAATRREEADDLDILGIHESDEILHDDVHAVFMEIAVVAEREEIQLQALALHHPLFRHISNDNIGKIRLPCDRAQRSELRAVELDPVVVLRMLVLESLQKPRIVIRVILDIFISQ